MKIYPLHLHHKSTGFLPRPPIRRRTRLPKPRPPPPRQNPSTAAARSSNCPKVGGGALEAKPASASPATERKVYEDNWFDGLAINYMSSCIQATLGVKIRNGENREGYEGLVEAATMISRRHGAMEQQEKVLEALNRALPEFIFSMASGVLFKILQTSSILATPSKFSRELFARITTIFFSWLVGTCEVRESEIHRKREKNVVYIRHCRFLEATNCVGMCTNLCKLPSQKFIYKSLGMPTTMVPNFEDQSCEIVFGQTPPADDPALKQPCYQKSCIAKQTYGVDCSS
ncbi:beta-carotene isomerase D27, chloroplastic-like [Phalaenopsis equestris]|uniref:beta-carotene isomerase D27, chloroplastic-like n=1 Tax=Phalaenopsis equestris TaxID=78828 RepID=UPI0009E3B39A|nr:beta-carotene isomerase D27, chloroplastic-like [Phalaenopsis equestris]